MHPDTNVIELPLMAVSNPPPTLIYTTPTVLQSSPTVRTSTSRPSVYTSLYKEKDLGRSLFSPVQVTELGCGTVLLSRKVILTSGKDPGSQLWSIALDRFHHHPPKNPRIPSAQAYMVIIAPARVKWCRASFNFCTLFSLQ